MKQLNLDNEELQKLLKQQREDIIQEFKAYGLIKERKIATFDEAYKAIIGNFSNEFREPTLVLLELVYSGKNGLFTFLTSKGLKNIDEITLLHLNEYKNYLISLYNEKKLAGSTIATYLEYGRIFLKYLLKLGYIENFFENFRSPVLLPLTSLMKEKNYELGKIIEVVNAYFDEYLAEKSKVCSKSREFVRGIKPEVLKQFLAYLMTVSFVCRRKEPLDIELNNILKKEKLLKMRGVTPEAINFLDVNDRVVIYIKKSKKTSKDQIRASYIHPILSVLLDELLFYIDSLKAGNTRIKKGNYYSKGKSKKLRFVDGKLNPDIEIKYLFFSDKDYEKHMSKEALTFFHNKVCKDRGIKHPGFHSIKYFIATNYKSKLLRFDLERAQDLEAHAKGTILQDIYNIKKIIEQIAVSKQWQEKLWNQTGLSEIRDYLSNRKNFEATHLKKGRKEKREPVKEDIIKEINRIHRNKKTLNVKNIAKYFHVSQNWVNIILRDFFNGPEFADLRSRKRLDDEKREKILEDIKKNLENKSEGWSDIARRHGVEPYLVSRLCKRVRGNSDNKSWKMELYKELKLKFLGKPSKSYDELAMQFGKSVRTIQLYMREFKNIFYLDLLFNLQVKFNSD